MAINLSRATKSCCRSGHSALQATRRMPLWTLAIALASDGQEHKIIWRAGPEQDTIFYLRVTACREQGSHCHDERLAWVASRGQWNSYSSSFVSKVLGANYNRASILWLINSPCTGQEVLTSEPTSNAHARVDY